MPRRRPRDLRRSLGTPSDVARQTAIDARKMREEAGDEGVNIYINTKNGKRNMARGGDVCKPNQRTGNIDMRTKGMVRHIRNNLKA